MNPNVAGQIRRKLAVCFEQNSAFMLFCMQFPSREKTDTNISESVSSCHKTIKVAEIKKWSLVF